MSKDPTQLFGGLVEKHNLISTKKLMSKDPLPNSSEVVSSSSSSDQLVTCNSVASVPKLGGYQLKLNHAVH